MTTREFYAAERGIERTLRLFAGPTSESEARRVAERQPGAEVVSAVSVELMTSLGGFTLEDRRGHERRARR